MATLHPSQLAGFDSTTIYGPVEVKSPVIDVPVTVEDAQKLAYNNIDQAAGKIRLNYITSAPGQTEIYLEKTEEAIDYTVAGYPEDASMYPFVIAEANASGISCQDAAKLIIQKKSQWIIKAAAIEEVRRKGKLTIGSLSSVDEITKMSESVIAQINKL